MLSRAAVCCLTVLALVASDAGARPHGGRPEAKIAAPGTDARGAGALTVSTARPRLANVERQLVLELPRTERDATVRLLPAALGVELDIQAPVADVRAAIASAIETSPDAWYVDAREILDGTRARVVHRDRSIAAAVGRADGRIVVAFGALGEEARLRAFADTVRLPLPEPTELGADLEVWQEAERSIAAGELPEAKRRWERLADQPKLADLAALRTAELYIASGHVNEALAQLRAVSRRFPRSTGAALARLDVLHLEALTGLARAEPEQVDVAAASVDRAAFEAFISMRAAMVLVELGEHELALRHLPDPSGLPAVWRGPASALGEDLVASTIVAPALRGDPRGTAVHHVRWSVRVDRHADRDRILDVVAAAYTALGLHDRAVPLLRARLRELPGAIDEADVVGRLAHGYRMLGDRVRAHEALDFQVAAHPRAPGLVAELRAEVIATAAEKGLLAARGRMSELKGRTTDSDVRVAISTLGADVAEAWGTPAQIVQALSGMTSDADPARAQSFAIALARAGRADEAAPRLREWIDRTADPEARDRLSYHLALCEIALGHRGDADRILGRIAIDGTRWGLVARARLREETLARTVAALEPPRGETTP